MGSGPADTTAPRAAEVVGRDAVAATVATDRGREPTSGVGELRVVPTRVAGALVRAQQVPGHSRPDVAAESTRVAGCQAPPSPRPAPPRRANEDRSAPLRKRPLVNLGRRRYEAPLEPGAPVGRLPLPASTSREAEVACAGGGGGESNRSGETRGVREEEPAR